MTTVEVDDGTGFTAIEYSSATVENAISDRKIAPTASVEVADRTAVSSGDDLRITEGATTVFDGRVTKTKPRRRNPPEVTAKHRAYNLFEESVTIDVTGTDADVLTAALNDASSGGGFTLAYDGTPTTLGDAYAVEGRTVKRVFRDMVDRVDRVWWIGADSTIHVEERGARGTLQTIDTATDDAVVRDYTPDDTETVVNDVTVVGTGGEQVTGSAQDSISISDFGRKPERVNVSYVRTATEANDYANALLVPDPLESADLRVSNQDLQNAPEPIVNYEIAVDDAALGVDSTLLVEGQTISEQVTDLALGEGAGVNAAKYNRQQKSTDDITEPGSVYDSDRIADDAIGEGKLVDLSVTEQKLADLAVAQQKLQNNAVVNGKLADLSVSETKIQDDSISTPKLVAEAVTAAEIEADTITAAQIASGTITAQEIEALTITSGEIDSRTIRAINIRTDELTANEIEASTITADEIDTLDLETDQLTVGDSSTSATIDFDVDFGTIRMIPNGSVAIGTQSAAYSFGAFQTFEAQTIQPTQGDDTGNIGAGDAYSEIHAYEFIDAGTGSAINDGGDPLAGLAEGRGPPDHAKRTDEQGEAKGYSLNDMARSAWDVIRAQERLIEDLEARVAELEDAVDPNA